MNHPMKKLDPAWNWKNEHQPAAQLKKYASAAKCATGYISYWRDKANSIRQQCGFYPIESNDEFTLAPRKEFTQEQKHDIMFFNGMQQTCKNRLAAITSAALTMVAYELTGSDIYFSIEL